MMEAASTYRAVQAVGQGRLKLTEKTFHAPGPDKVRSRVEACGVCHSDSCTAEGLFPIDWPRVPGHEVVGRIVVPDGDDLPELQRLCDGFQITELLFEACFWRQHLTGSTS
jgi:alcohol dehydrogenase, propanol-preferring